jgi:hypothetical protein
MNGVVLPDLCSSMHSPRPVDKHLSTMPAKPAPEIQRADKNGGAEKEPSPDNNSRIPEPWWRTSRIPPGAVYPARIVGRHIDNIRGYRLYADVAFLDHYLLLVGRYEVPLGLCLGAEALDGIHNLLLLAQESVAHFICQCQLVAHHGQHIGEVTK